MAIYNIMDSHEHMCHSSFRKVTMCDKSHIFHKNMIVQSMYTEMPNQIFGSTIPPIHLRQVSSLEQFSSSLQQANAYKSLHIFIGDIISLMMYYHM